MMVMQKEMNEALKVISSVVKSRNINPILDCVNLSYIQDRLRLKAGTIDKMVTVEINAGNKETGEVNVDAKTLANLISLLTEEEIYFDVKKYNLHIESNGKYKLHIVQEEFPKVEEGEYTFEFTMNAERLKDILSRAVKLISTEAYRPAMQGINISCSNNVLNFIATNGHSLGWIKEKTESLKEISIILPADVVSTILKLNAEEIKISISTTFVKFETDNITLVTRLIDGKYPDYKAVIPERQEQKVKIKTNELLNAVKRMLVISKDNVNLKFSKGIELNSTDRESGNSVEMYVECEYFDEEKKVTFNTAKLLQIIEQIKTDTFEMSIKDGKTAVSFMPANVDELYLLMPIR